MRIINPEQDEYHGIVQVGMEGEFIHTIFFEDNFSGFMFVYNVKVALLF